MKPLVSILIPAYNAERWIGEALRSALGQTWPCKEIIVVNDGSTDRTAEIVERFAPAVKMITTENRGLSAAVNRAYQASQGDYIQELDADDILAPDKIERQLGALGSSYSKRVLFSSPWASFFYRTRCARFVQTTLCQDLSPVDWLLAKMGENLHMQNATWLVSRELAEAAGPWNERLRYDQDGEYFVRVVIASDGIRFIPGPSVYYRATGGGSISTIGNSNAKRESLLVSMKLHIQYLRSLEDSERVRRACLAYLQNWYGVFDPERPDLASQLQVMASELGGNLNPPRLRRKYSWMAPLLGQSTAKRAQEVLPQFKASCRRQVDRVLHHIDMVRTAKHSVA
jgi:glycosyltransferase involved in cell wall biosynthesis